MRKTTIILFLLLALLPSVSASFLAFGDATITAQPCTTTTRTITVQNTGAEQASYSISIDGKASDWITFTAINFDLNPGQHIQINSQYAIPCDARGTYSATIYFTDGEEEQELQQEIEITIPENINITTRQTSAVITPCETAAYTITLHNPANFTEIYAIKAEGHLNIHASEKQSILEPGEQKNIIITVTPDDCTQSGNYPLKVTFKTEKSEQQKEQNLELLIKTTDIPILAEETKKIRTDYTDSTAELTIQNTGDRTTQYFLELQGINWATINPSTISLNPGETKTTALRLTPGAEIPKGTYELIFSATVEQTGIKYSKELTIKLQPPTFIEKNPLTVIIIAAVLLILLVCVYFSVKYARSPKFKEAYKKWQEKRKIRAEKRKQAREKIEAIRKAQEQKRAELLKKRQEQQKKELERKQAEKEKIKQKIQKELEQEFKKEYHVIAKKDIVLGKTKKNTIKTFAIIAAILLAILLAAFWSIIIPNIQYVTLGLAILCIIFISKKLSRNKLIKTSWKNLIEKQTKTITAWNDGLSQLSITAKKPVQNCKLLIKKTKPKVAPSPAVYQTFALKTNTPEALTYKATFTISKKWLARNEEIRLARYSNQDWTTISLKKSGEDKKTIHYTAELSKTGTYSLYAKPKKQQKSHKAKIILAITALAIIIAIAVILSPQPTTKAYGIPPQVWQQDTVHRIDLSKYFSDPDQDKLEYTTTETSHILVEISGNTAYLTPENGWTGEERVKFTANDGKEGQATSNTVFLRVQKQLISPKIQPYIAIILSIIAVLLLVWIAYKHQSKRTNS